MNYKLKNEFVDKYKKVTPKFGFNGLGELVYYDRYSRLKDDGYNETWWETIRRVVEGTYSIQKRHILRYGLGWDGDKAHRSAEEMYDRMFNMKFLPPGRGLWAMGTNIIEEKALFAALNNCAFVSTAELDKDFSKPFEFMMDRSMLGVGTGFDVKGAGLLTIKKPVGKFEYIIPDSREGWIESLRYALNAYFKGEAKPTFKYTQLRPFGAPIKTFGGTASGPAPLRKLHEQLDHLLSHSIGKDITLTQITDIMNMIGVCVVSGNVRRTAQIVFGKPDNEEYLKLKDYEWDSEKETYTGSNIHRAEFAWTSNNSVFADIGMDYSRTAASTARNGEPGYAWIDNMRTKGRMKDLDNGKDIRAVGANPCMEQTLESYEMCCLVETFLPMHDSIEDFKRTLKFAYLYAKTVTLGKDHWMETNRVQLRNRRIGASLSGIAQFLEHTNIDTLKHWLDEGYETIQYYDNMYSEWLAVPKSIKTTSVKPSGKVSLLAGVTPGIHFPESNYYIRRVRVQSNSTLLPFLEKAGYKIEKDVNAPDTTNVVEVPVAIEGMRTLKDVSMWEQMELAAFLQEHWSDNQVSCTVTFKPEEAKDIKSSLNYFQYKLKGISFLPKTETGKYAQMPYEEITKEKYEELAKNIKSMKIKNVQEDSKPEKFCNNDICEVL